MRNLGLGLGQGLALGPIANRPSFDLFVSDLAAGGGNGSYANPYLPTELTALATLPAGTRVGIRAGGAFLAANFNPLLSIGGNGLQFGPYGDGDKPLFLLRAPISGAWASLGSNLWRWSGTQANNIKMSGNVFRDGVPMQLVQNSGGLDAAGKALVTAWGWGGTGITATGT
ncbi:MAG: hypothetical protein ABL879_11160, partial [Devosia sp.]